MAKPFGECEIKGQTIDQHLGTEKGRKLLAWIVNQPVEDGKFKDWTIKRNEYIRSKIGDVQVGRVEVSKPSRDKLDVIIEQLSVIIEMLEARSND